MKVGINILNNMLSITFYHKFFGINPACFGSVVNSDGKNVIILQKKKLKTFKNRTSI
jgi:hypothetical protein